MASDTPVKPNSSSLRVAKEAAVLEQMYVETLEAAQSCTGFILNDDGVLNRPFVFARALNKLTKDGLPDNAIYAATIGVLAAALFPRGLDRMGAAERDEFARFSRRYVPRDELKYKIFSAVFSAARDDLFPRLRNVDQVFGVGGETLFTPPENPYAARTVKDLALMYHMATRLQVGEAVEIGYMFKFLHGALHKGEDDTLTRELSRPVLEEFAQRHFLGLAQGDATVFLTVPEHRNLAFRLYVNHALDRFFAQGAIAERPFCAQVAHCTVRAPNFPPRRIVGEPAQFDRRARNGQSLDNTAVDLFLAAALFDDD